MRFPILFCLGLGLGASVLAQDSTSSIQLEQKYWGEWIAVKDLQARKNRLMVIDSVGLHHTNASERNTRPTMRTEFRSGNAAGMDAQYCYDSSKTTCFPMRLEFKLEQDTLLYQDLNRMNGTVSRYVRWSPTLLPIPDSVSTQDHIGTYALPAQLKGSLVVRAQGFELKQSYPIPKSAQMTVKSKGKVVQEIRSHWITRLHSRQGKIEIHQLKKCEMTVFGGKNCNNQFIAVALTRDPQSKLYQLQTSLPAAKISDALDLLRRSNGMFLPDLKKIR